MKKGLALLAIGCLAALLPAPLLAHEGPHAEIAALDARLEKTPDDVDLLLRRADLHRREGHLAKALADVERAAKLAPARRDVLCARGLVRVALGQTTLAEADLTAFLAAGPPTIEALVSRAELRLAAKRVLEARADYDAALAIRPTPELFVARGKIDEASGDLARAARGYEEGLRRAGGAVSIRLALIRVELSQGHADRVIALVDEVLPSASFKADWLLLRAGAHEVAGRKEQARADREAALAEATERVARRPTDLSRITRARALLSLGKAEDALSELTIVRAKPSHLPEADALFEEASKKKASSSAH